MNLLLDSRDVKTGNGRDPIFSFPDPLSYAENPGPLRFSLLTVPDVHPETDLTPERRRILNVVLDLGGTARPKQVAAELGEPAANVAQTMRRMEIDDQLVKVRKGVYYAPGHEPEGVVPWTRSAPTSVVSEPGRGLVEIKRVELVASAGPGADVDIEAAEAGVWVDPSFAWTAFGVSADRVRVIDSVGTSMYPTIQPGERLFVVLHEPNDILHNGRIYVVHGPHGLLVKRLHFGADPGGRYVLLESDSPSDDDIRVPLDVFEEDYRVVALLRYSLRPH